MELFDTDMFHMGGDEVNLNCWNSSQEVHDVLEREGKLGTEEELLDLWKNFQEQAAEKVYEAGGRAEVSLAGSLQIGVYCLSGPLVGKLVTAFGARPVCIAGALLASVGLLSASFATSLGLLILGYSVITGCGFGLMYIPCVVGVAPYFTDRRALAIGICLCGSGFGTFGLAPISQHILDAYGWRWVLRALSVFTLAGVLCGSVMVPVDIPEEDDANSRCPPRKRHRLVSLVLGDDLAKSRRLSVYYVFTVSDFLAFTAIYIPYTHLPPLAKYRNISSGDAAFLISAGGI